MIARLKEARNEKGLSQKDLAKKINLTQQTYSDYETGRTNPDIDTLTKIADILEISVDFLLGRSDDLGTISVKNENPVQLTADGKELLDIFNALAPEHKKQILEYARYFGTRSGIFKRKA